MENKKTVFSQLCCMSGKLAAVLMLGLWAHSASADTCWKDSYGRGVGTIPNVCPAGFSPTLVGTCLSNCPPGYRDDGLFCRKAEYGRGAGYALWDANKCNRENPATGCEKCLLMYYPKCAPGFKPVGCNICAAADPVCPAGWTEFAGSCTKKSIPASCGAKQMDAGLCYNSCGGSMNGIGPVCWGGCPAGMIDCGAMCGSSVAECGSDITNMVVSVGSVAAKVASIVGTAGAAVGVTAATEAAKTAAINALKETAKTVAKTLLKSLAGVAKEQLVPRVAAELRKLPNMPPFLVDKLAKLAVEPDTFDVAEFVKGLDPTGIGKVVDAFNKKICGK